MRESYIHSEMDDQGIHLGAFHKGELLACVTAYPVTGKEDTYIKAGHPIPPIKRVGIHYTKRIGDLKYRGIRLNEYVFGIFVKEVYEAMRPDVLFGWVFEWTHSLMKYYKDMWYFGEGDRVVLKPLPYKATLIVCRNEEEAKGHYEKALECLEKLEPLYGDIQIPSLREHMKRYGLHSSMLYAPD